MPFTLTDEEAVAVAAVLHGVKEIEYTSPFFYEAYESEDPGVTDPRSAHTAKALEVFERLEAEGHKAPRPKHCHID